MLKRLKIHTLTRSASSDYSLPGLARIGTRLARIELRHALRQSEGGCARILGAGLGTSADIVFPNLTQCLGAVQPGASSFAGLVTEEAAVEFGDLIDRKFHETKGLE